MKTPNGKARGDPSRPPDGGRNPWKVINPTGIRWANTFQTEAKAWIRIIAAHGMQGVAGAKKLMLDRGWKVVRN